MAISIPVGQAQAVLRWTLTGDPEEMICTLGIDPEAETDPLVIAQAVYTAATATGSLTPAAAMNAFWTFVGVTVYLQSDPGTVVGNWTVPITATGSTHVTLPHNCAFLVRKYTALSGRNNRGRMYLPPYAVAESDVTSQGVILAATYTTVQNRVAEFFLNLNSAGMFPVLFHSLPVDSTPITAMVLDTVIATQRRRLRN